MKTRFLSSCIALAATVCAVALSACGGDSSSGDKNSEQSVSTKTQLPECEKSVYGEIYFVEKENAYFECVEDFWERADEKPDEGDRSSSSKNRSSSSMAVSEGDTAKVDVVAVDSVNVSGFAHKGPFVDGAVVSITGLDSADSKTVFKGKVAGDSGYFTVKGVSLKSQFALVSIYGNYMNEVSGKKSSAKTTLEALMDLSKDSTVNVTLFSHLAAARARELVDVQGFNYNAAMDKAYDELALAVSNLVAHSRPELADSIKSLNLKNVNLNGKDLATAALYAVSILMQADLSLSGYGKRLDAVAASFAESGDLSGVLKEVSAMADYASVKDSANGYAALRINAEDFKLADTVPDFESILYAFWTGLYGLGECTANQEETAKENTDELSENSGLKYVCTSNRWHKATELEQKIGLCTEKASGKISKAGDETYYCDLGEWHLMTALESELGLCRDSTVGKEGKFEKKDYYCERGVWNEKTALESKLGLCRDSTVGDIGAFEDSKYYCEKNKWNEMTDVEKAVGLCRDSTAAKFGKDGGKDYYCDGKSWTEVTAVEGVLGLCADSSDGKIGEFEDSKYYCEKNKWNEMTNVEKSIGLCRDSTAKNFGDAEGAYYYCDGEAWQSVDKTEYQLKKLCTKENVEEFVQNDDKTYYCERKADGNSFVWRPLTDVEEKLGVCEMNIMDSVGWAGRLDSTASFRKPLPDTTDKDGKYYACNGTEWVPAERSEYWYGLCDSRNEGEYMDWGYLVNASRDSVTLVNGDVVTTIAAAAAVLATLGEDNATLYAQCVKGVWTSSTEIDNFLGKVKCTTANKNKTTVVGSYEPKCDGTKWVNYLRDARDKQLYKLAKIGDQWWMAQNLNYRYVGIGFESNYPLANHDDSTSWYYEGQPSSTYGRLYTWSAAMDSAGKVDKKNMVATNVEDRFGCGQFVKCVPNTPHRGICPSGWHVPTVAEFETLVDAVGGLSKAGYYLKSDHDWVDGGIDSYGFSLFPTGYRGQTSSGEKEYYGLGIITVLWSSEEIGTTSVNGLRILNEDKVEFADSYKKNQNALSLRCLRD